MSGGEKMKVKVWCYSGYAGHGKIRRKDNILNRTIALDSKFSEEQVRDIIVTHIIQQRNRFEFVQLSRLDMIAEIEYTKIV